MQNFKHSMRTAVLSTAFAAVCFGITSISAQAQQLNGSLPLAGFGVTQDGANLLASTTITDAFAITSGAGALDYLPIPLPTTYATTALVLANPTTFSISNASYGSFAATSDVVVTHTATNYDVELFGTYTPGPMLPGFSPTGGELRVSINQSGTSLAEAITLSTPPIDTPPVPEPGMVAMLAGMGISGSAFVLRRRRRAQ